MRKSGDLAVPHHDAMAVDGGSAGWQDNLDFEVDNSEVDENQRGQIDKLKRLRDEAKEIASQIRSSQAAKAKAAEEQEIKEERETQQRQLEAQQRRQQEEEQAHSEAAAANDPDGSAAGRNVRAKATAQELKTLEEEVVKKAELAAASAFEATRAEHVAIAVPPGKGKGFAGGSGKTKGASSRSAPYPATQAPHG